jgi:hypothetical protein
MDTERHFLEMSRGKGACDPSGKQLKKLAKKASLQNPYEKQIRPPRLLHKRAVVKIPSVSYEDCSGEDHSK